MSHRRLLPRLDLSSANKARRALMDQTDELVFEPADLDAALSRPGVFPPTGGSPSTVDDLLVLRQTCLDAVERVEESSPSFGNDFDLALGRVLFDASQGRVGEFGDAAVWDFLTLVLLPDLVLPRITHVGRPSAASFKARLTGGNRRHVLQRLWRRWAVFGAEIVESQGLTEDDHVALLERDITSQRPVLARLVAERIVRSEFEAGERRLYTRNFMRRLQAASGFLVFTDERESVLVAIVEHIDSETKAAMSARRGQGTDVVSDAVSIAPEPVGTEPVAAPSPTARRRPLSLRQFLSGR